MNETTDKLLRDLASQLGTTVTNLWDVAVHGSWAWGISMIPIVAILLILTFVCARSAIKNYKKDYMDVESFAPQVSLGLFFGLIGCLCLQSAIIHIIAPEYKALEMILGVFR